MRITPLLLLSPVKHLPSSLQWTGRKGGGEEGQDMRFHCPESTQEVTGFTPHASSGGKK